MKILGRLLLIAFLLLTAAGLQAQRRDSLLHIADTVSLNTKMKAVSKYAEEKSSAELAADKTSMEQYDIIEQLLNIIQKAKTYLKSVSDTSTVPAAVVRLDRDYYTAIDGILINRHKLMTYRNLTASINILRELVSTTEFRKKELNLQRTQLTLFRYQIDSLMNLRPLYTFNSDSVSLIRYLKQLAAVNRQIHPVDSTLDKTSHIVQMQIVEIITRLNQLIDAEEEMIRMSALSASRLWERETPGPLNAFNTGTTLRNASEEAVRKGSLTLLFYITNNQVRIWVGILLLVIVAVYLASLKKASSTTYNSAVSKGGALVLQYPFLSALLVVSCLYQFVFSSPPFAFSAGIWIIASVALTIVFHKHIAGYWLRVWLSIAILFALASCLNLLLQPSQAELFLVSLVTLGGVAVGGIALFRGPRNELREKWILYPISVMMLLEAGAFLSCITGRYNLCKSLMIIGFFSVLIAILFLWTARLVNDWLLMASEVYQQQNRKFFYLNPDKIGQRAPFIFYLLLVIGWTLIVGRNFPGFNRLTEPLNNFLSGERSLGEYSFSISNVLLFIGIMATAVIVSRIVSFFTSDQLPKSSSPLHKMQSWLLLVRIAIISIGLFLAVAATGIPLDRLTIVLGALSVGVGFGLQALVNNLVSGLIIAFERPVHVGDHVDIDGQAGVMKSIGFRSSVIYTQEGADMIIPNGDVLNAHLINWSLGGNRKRLKIGFSVPFEEDIDKVKELVTRALEQDNRILRLPSPVVQFDQVRNGMIEVLVFFWPQSLAQGPQAQSDLVALIVKLFKENGLTIPIPQQELYIHNDPNRKPDQS
jgi:potassium efflux system protein